MAVLPWTQNLHELVLRFAALPEAVPEIVEADLKPCAAWHWAAASSTCASASRRSPVERVKTW